MPEGFMGGFAQGMSPMMQSLLYAQALRNSGMTNPATGAPYSADQGGSMLGNAARWVGRQFGLAGRPQATAANPYVAPQAPATPSPIMTGVAPANWPSAPQFGPPAPVGTGTTQGQRPVTFTPPIPPPQFPQSPIAQQGPPQPLPRPAPMPPMPTALNAGDVGSGSLMFAPGVPGGFGAFGDITRAPGAAGNFQNQFGWGLPTARYTPRKYFTERYGQEPDYRQMNARGSPWSANYGA